MRTKNSWILAVAILGLTGQGWAAETSPAGEVRVQIPGRLAARVTEGPSTGPAGVM